MIAQSWTATLVPGREADYDAFAARESAPMFRALPGCLGVLFLGDGLARTVLSLWREAADIEALDGNAAYQATAARLAASGILAATGPVTLQASGAGAFAGEGRHEALALAQAAAGRFLDGLATRPAAQLAPFVPVEVPDGLGLAAAVDHFETRIAPALSGSNGPRYFGYVTGGASPAGLAGDWLAAATNQNVSNDLGSVAAAVERATARRFGELFGLDPALVGHFTSGATASNLVCLASARQALHRRLGHDSAETGLAGAPPVRVLAGAAHSSIGKVMTVMGLGRAALQPVACLPGRTAVDPAALEALLAEGHPATLVVASAGEVNTGDFDDLVAVAAACRRHGAWLHVDGAFGLFAAFSPAHAPLLAGLARADSVTVDLHKWLNVPYDAAIAYVREPARQREVFRASAAYLGDSDDPLHFTPENSRRFRALPAWMVLASEGRAGIAAAVVRNCAQARALGMGIAAMPALELLDDVRLNIVCFARGDDPSAAARDALLARLNADGRAFMTPTVLRGRPGIRAAFSNWSTGDADVATTLDALRDALA